MMLEDRPDIDIPVNYLLEHDSIDIELQCTQQTQYIFYITSYFNNKKLGDICYQFNTTELLC
jgi:hypothetical protein